MGHSHNWNDLEDKILWAEANRADMGEVTWRDWVTSNVFSSMATYAPVRDTVLGKPGAVEAMEVRRGTPAPSTR
jgi:hypothetical protein